jgi:hypothetical protein
MRAALSANSAERVSILDAIGNRILPGQYSDSAAHKSNVNGASGWNKNPTSDVLGNEL